ncbi:coiled-coil domain-containing protein 86 [Bombus vosnesenskii]|uniref:Coiled-coil domain-containing protein 86 n=2 Tax=Pyrobombus TaxID=144703 RepID=A0A6J3K7T7_9HYME|nr:coiled-coil domain-containing protein 86 [Bombus impatiens]XP_033199269.1 coiled-coil domain-containing protein 86 [Bombus vancouverensis nearcticus]XP_033348214.1 coiled-coil domain-containing protein 86 [Bombus vosnesenskii]XP_050490665.1 coiled-coil domain-containing protein 86 [Bombus huntii]
MTTDEKVTTAEEILSDKLSDIADTNNIIITNNTKKVKAKKEKSFEQQIPKGKPKSGRIWKEQKKRFSSIVKTRGIRLSFDKKQKLRDDLKHVKEMSRAIKAEKQAEKEAKKERRRANLKRTKENEKKGEVVQVITNTAKLKKIKKKHLRMIQKRDTLNL